MPWISAKDAMSPMEPSQLAQTAARRGKMATPPAGLAPATFSLGGWRLGRSGTDALRAAGVVAARCLCKRAHVPGEPVGIGKLPDLYEPAPCQAQ